MQYYYVIFLVLLLLVGCGIYAYTKDECELCLKTTKGLLPMTSRPKFCDSDPSVCVSCKPDAAKSTYTTCDHKLQKFGDVLPGQYCQNHCWGVRVCQEIV